MRPDSRAILALAALLAAGVFTSSCAPAATSQTAPTAQAPGLMAWVAPGMERVAREGPPGAGLRTELYAARGEFEPFQVVVQAPAGGLSGVGLVVSDLNGPAGATIESAEFALYREHYVEVRPGSPDPGGDNGPLGPGWYADALIPFTPPAHQGPASDAVFRAAPVDVPAGQRQPYWVDLFVPRDAAPGRYTGSFTITSDQGTATGAIVLTVWNFTLPLRPSLISSFDLEEADSLGNLKELLRHRLMPKEVRPEFQDELRDDWGLGAVDLRGLWSGANRKTCTMDPAPDPERMRAAVKGFASDLLVYNLTADEVDSCPGLDAQLGAWSTALRAEGVANLVTMMPTTELLAGVDGRPAVDIWVVLPKRYVAAPELAAAAAERGTSLWSYNAGVQDDFSPKWQIDFAPINFRIQPGFLSQSLGMTGLLYWRIDLWTEQPWTDVNTYFNGRDYLPGDGMLVYPGEPAGVNGFTPSLRLKWLREGVEDYEYVALLKARGEGEQAMRIVRSVATDWRTWTKDPNALEHARRQLGAALDN